jgi:hypothetical protein
MPPLSGAERQAALRARQTASLARIERAVINRQDCGAATLSRALTAHLIQHIEQFGFESAEDIVARHWPADNVAAPLVTKATSSSATTATYTPPTIVVDFINSLTGVSAGAAMLSRGLSVPADTGYQFLFPAISANANYAGFFAEEIPIAVEQLTTNGLVLSLRKFGSIIAVSREVFQYSIPAIERIVRTVLNESVSLSLDAAMFSATAGDASRPPGLLLGVGASSASSETDKSTAMHADIATLVSGVAAVAGPGPILIVAAPAQGRRLKTRLAAVADPGFELFISSALSEGTLIACASNCLCSAIDPTPRFEDTGQPTLVFDDTAPQGLTTSAVSGTVKSLFQIDSIGTKLVLRLSWGLRSSTGVCWIQNSVW